MASEHERFWEHRRYAVVGHSSQRPFPKLTYAGLKRADKEVYAVDASADGVEGDPAYDDLGSLPAPVDAVVLEVPREQTAAWVRRTADAGIGRVWLHQGTDTPEALVIAEERGLEVHTGGCAVMYLSRGFNVHTVHRAAWKLFGRY